MVIEDFWEVELVLSIIFYYFIMCGKVCVKMVDVYFLVMIYVYLIFNFLKRWLEMEESIDMLCWIEEVCIILINMLVVIIV